VDVEPTIEFILQMQAKSEAKLDQLAEELAAERLSHERRMNARDERLRRIVRLGVQEARAERRERRKMRDEWETRSKAADERIARLEANIDSFIKSMQRGADGHP
jgi:hypothetical protein